MLNNNTFHLGLNSNDCNNALLALLPGDPNRVEKIAKLMNNPKYLINNREFTIWYAEISKKPIIICSTGIGGPSTSIAVEELAQLGIKTFLRIGTAGAIQPYIQIGNVLIINAAVRYDGASQHFAPIEFPAVADLSCSIALKKAAKLIGIKTYWGINVSSDTFYPGQERLDTYSGRVIQKFRGSMKEWKNMGVISYDMESATLLTMCASQGLKAGVVVGVIVNRSTKEIPNTTDLQNAEYSSIKVGIEASRILLEENEH